MTQKTNFTRSVLRGSTALSALALLGTGLATSMIVATSASAQDYTSGAVSGTVTDASGVSVSGATVTLTSTGQGFTRTATTSDGGTFRFVGLSAGAYDVSVEAAGQPGYRAEGVRVLPSQTAALDIVLGAEEIVVTGSSISTDFTGTTTGVNIDLAEFVKTTPISRDLTSVVLLAPGTSLGDDGFGNLASIGGSSVAENAYYLNGLNTTNFDNYLGSAQVPFEFYRSVEVKSGGYSAEFGRATGGIVNAVSKAGSNDFMAAMHLNWSPNFLRSKPDELFNCATKPCSRTTNRSFDRTDTYNAILEAGGPILRDRLFIYGLVEFRRTETLRNSRSARLGTELESTDPFYAVKLDAYPIDGQHFELTMFDTRATQHRTDRTMSSPPASAALPASARPPASSITIRAASTLSASIPARSPTG